MPLLHRLTALIFAIVTATTAPAQNITPDIDTSTIARRINDLKLSVQPPEGENGWPHLRTATQILHAPRHVQANDGTTTLAEDDRFWLAEINYGPQARVPAARSLPYFEQVRGAGIDEQLSRFAASPRCLIPTVLDSTPAGSIEWSDQSIDYINLHRYLNARMRLDASNGDEQSAIHPFRQSLILNHTAFRSLNPADWTNALATGTESLRELRLEITEGLYGHESLNQIEQILSDLRPTCHTLEMEQVTFYLMLQDADRKLALPESRQESSVLYDIACLRDLHKYLIKQGVLKQDDHLFQEFMTTLNEIEIEPNSSACAIHPTTVRQWQEFIDAMYQGTWMYVRLELYNARQGSFPASLKDIGIENPTFAHGTYHYRQTPDATLPIELYWERTPPDELTPMTHTNHAYHFVELRPTLD